MARPYISEAAAPTSSLTRMLRTRRRFDSGRIAAVSVATNQMTISFSS